MLLKILLFLSISLSLPHTSSSARYIADKLQELLLNSTEIKGIYENERLKKPEDTNLPYENERLKMDLFLKELKNGLEPIGKGGFGRVFRVEDTSQASNSTKDENVFAVKEVFFENDWNSPEGQKAQTLLAKEIVFTKELERVDPEKLFFPEYFFFMSATEEFESEATKISDPAILENLKMDDSHDVALFFMESMDWTLDVYEYNVITNNALSHLLTRLRIFANVSSAIKMMLPLMSHCDLKPSNIMFKKISKQRSAELMAKGHLSLRLSPSEYYQVKIIDFGLLGMGIQSERKCSGGTLKYLPNYYVWGEKPATKIDVYAIGIMMFDMEVADLRISRISEIMKIVNHGTKAYLKYNNSYDFEKYIKKQENSLKNNGWYHIMNHLWKTQPESTILQYLEKEIDMECIKLVKSSFKKNSLAEIDLFEFISFESLFLYHTLLALVELFLDIQFKDEYVQKQISTLEKTLEEVEASMRNSPEDSDEYQKAVELKKYYETRITLENELADIRLELLKYLLTNVINVKDSRPEMAEFSHYVNSILNEITFGFKKEWEYIFQIEDHYWIVGENKIDETKQSLKKHLSENSEEPNPFARLRPKFILL